MLKQAEQGDDVGPSVQRDRLLAGLRHLLVDEYQEGDANHFALISAVAGRTLNSEEDRLSLLVVGDDDQNVYAFGGANVRFIRQFESDYQAKRFHLVENYRSTKHDYRLVQINRPQARGRMRQTRCRGSIMRDAISPPVASLLSVIRLPRGGFMSSKVPVNTVQEVVSRSPTRAPNQLQPEGGGYWGTFRGDRRHWDRLERLEALLPGAGEISYPPTRDDNHSRFGHDAGGIRCFRF